MASVGAAPPHPGDALASGGQASPLRIRALGTALAATPPQRPSFAKRPWEPGSVPGWAAVPAQAAPAADDAFSGSVASELRHLASC